MSTIYKTEINTESSQTSNRIIEDAVQDNDEDRQNAYLRFSQFCIQINTEYQGGDSIKIANEFNEFDKFIIPFPMNFFENISSISENNIPSIFFDCLHMDKPYAVIHSCISLLNELLFHCHNVSQLFSSEQFINLLVENIKSSRNILRNENIAALSNILSEADEKTHEYIYSIFPSNILISIMNSNENDAILIENSLNFIYGITKFQIPDDIHQSILDIVNQHFTEFPILSLKIYEMLVEINKVYDGFNYQSINDIFSIESQINNDLLNECCIFIHHLLKYNSSVKNRFDVEKIAFFALIPIDSNIYNNKLKCNALIVLHDIGLFSRYIKTLMIQYNNLTNKCKEAAGYIIFDFAQTVNSQNVNLLITNESNIFSIAKDLLGFNNKKLMIMIFKSMQHFFEITQFSQHTIDMFTNEFPGDTIWQFIETNDEEVNQIAMNFKNACLSDDDDDE